MAVYTYGAVTDRGDIRRENQDSILCMEDLFVVADGMGGLSMGKQVSQYIIGRFCQWRETDFPAMESAGRYSGGDIQELLEQEIWDTNRKILEFASGAGCRCGSTLSLLFLYGGWYYIENMGDSRVYLFRDGQLFRLTEDQSLKAQLLREGRLTREEAETFPKSNVLTMCMGMFAEPQSFFTAGEVQAGDVFLLCSDGFYNPLSQEDIRDVLIQRTLPIQTRLALLRSRIGPGEARDNVSAIGVEIV